MKNSFDVLVLGAGMVGASAALALARKGFSIGLIEKQELAELTTDLSAQVDLRVSAISPGSQQLLQSLGVWNDVINLRSCDYHRMTVWHENGTAQMHFASEQIGISHLGTIVENRLLQSVLLQHLKHLPNVQVLPGQAIQTIQQEESTVQVTIGEGQLLKADLLIAADGRASTARELLHLPFTAGHYDQTAIVANVATEKLHQQTAWQRFMVTGPLAFLPLSNGLSSIVWSADTQRAEQLLGLSDEEFQLQLAEAFEFRLGNITSVSERAGFPLSWHSADQWLANRVLLIGDAAHGVHPLAGQGVNLGFGDVAMLSRLLIAHKPVYQHSLLRQFERQRKAETVTATHLFSALKLLYSQESGLVCRARDAGMSIVENNAMIKRMILDSAVHNMV